MSKKQEIRSEKNKRAMENNPASHGKKASPVKKARAAKKETPAKKTLTSKKSLPAEKAIPLKEANEAKKTTPGRSKKEPESTVTAPQVHTSEIPDIISEFDIYLFREGKHFGLYDKLGATVTEHNNQRGTFFSVWAPNAKSVSVIGNFNGWNKDANPMKLRYDESGIWEAFIPGIGKGEAYKYFIASKYNDYTVEKADPVAKYSETAPKTASIVWEYNYKWTDDEWMKNRKKFNSLESPFSVYEVHLESWRRNPHEGNRSLTYAELAEELAAYIQYMGYTHIELMPVTEYPFSGSWGYQVTGFFAPTSRFGTPDDFMYFIDYMHRNNIGVIIDWVPSHFPGDLHGLHFFDGTYLYEHQDPRKGFHPDWNSYIFNYGRNEIRNFLISSAHSWMDRFHIDGIRVDAVASMLYLDYSRKEGEWIPNEHGGRENLDAIHFMRDLNESLFGAFPDVQTIAEESTAWPMVTRPVYTGGLGFGMKWNMGWMHDTLKYFSHDPIYRSYHHNQITFSIMYAFSENFMLSLSHDEVVHGKGSLINKMPGDNWQKFANLRAMFGYMFAHPGKKLHFMGMEFGQWSEWNHQTSLDWHLTEHEQHHQLQFYIKDLNSIYRRFPAFYELDFNPDGFRWIDANDAHNSVLSFMRYSKNREQAVIVAVNLTPTPHHNYRIGVPTDNTWVEIINSDARQYGGSGTGNFGMVAANPIPYHGEEQSVNIMLPPLGIVMLTTES